MVASKGIIRGSAGGLRIIILMLPQQRVNVGSVFVRMVTGNLLIIIIEKSGSKRIKGNE